MKKKICLFLMAFTVLCSLNVYADPMENIVDTAVEVEVEKTPEELELEEAKVNYEEIKGLMGVKDEGREISVFFGTETKFKEKVLKEKVEVKNEEKVEGAEETEEIEETEEEKEKYFFLDEFNTLLFTSEDKEYSVFLDEMKESVVKDAKNGFKDIKNSDIVINHIKLEHWGNFLEKYYGKDLNSFPLGKIVISYDKVEFTFVNSKNSKKLVIDEIIPQLIDQIVEESKNYPVKKYVLNIPSGMLLKDYVYDNNNVKEIETLYPFSSENGEYSFNNMGSYKGMTFSEEYTDILRGYIEDTNTAYSRRIEKDGIPGSVDVLSYIVLLKDISGNRLDDKVLTDFTSYKDLAISLDNLKLINTADSTSGVKRELLFTDYALEKDKLLLCPIKDTVVIIQPDYLECFEYKENGFNIDKNFGRHIDFTPFISNNANTYAIVKETGEQVNITDYSDENGILDSRLGRAPFLMYFSSVRPYKLLIDWGYNSQNSFKTEDERDAFITQIKNEMKEKGYEAELNEYIKAAGQMTDGTKMIIKIVALVGVLILILVVVLIIKKKKKAEVYNPLYEKNTNEDLLFNDESNDDDDDDDDDDGTFEFK